MKQLLILFICILTYSMISSNCSEDVKPDNLEGIWVKNDNPYSAETLTFTARELTVEVTDKTNNTSHSARFEYHLNIKVDPKWIECILIEGTGHYGDFEDKTLFHGIYELNGNVLKMGMEPHSDPYWYSIRPENTDEINVYSYIKQ